jgi:glycosyltransferase involved in cell wall biosynthesis
MIVVATNNGQEFLPRLLDSFCLHSTNGHKVLVVDTGSTDDAFKLYVTKLDKKDWPFEIEVNYIDFGRDTGAYIHGFKKYPKEKGYMFMHDSMEATYNNWLERFEEKAKENEIVVHSYIDMAQDKFKPEENLLSKMPFPYERPKLGVFGPIFYATKSFMEKCRTRGALNILPANREEAHTTERAWGAIIEKLGVKHDSVYGVFNHDDTINNRLKGLKKCFPIRP